jgi:L-Ala-D/L-Glu epimerase
METLSWPMSEPFAIARGVQTEQRTLLVELIDKEGRIGRGEACGVPYRGETPETMCDEIEDLVSLGLPATLTQNAVLDLLPAGGARMALDSALWDLRAKQSDVSPFRAFGLSPRPITTARTIGMRSLVAYEQAARALCAYSLLKVKVSAEHPLDAVRAVRRGAPRSRLIVDPNQSWTPDQVRALAPELTDLGVVLLEQPIPVGAEAQLREFATPVALCADELVNDEADLERARGCFSVINIKLDKAGGLTAAMRLADRANEEGFQVMVGCMAGSSLCMAPAMVLAQRCAFVDLDGPLLHSRDCEFGFVYDDGEVQRPHEPRLWG